MNRIRIIAFVATGSMLLAACSAGSGPTAKQSSLASLGAGVAAGTSDDSNCSALEDFCIGLVSDTGKIDDKSFNQSTWEGVQAGAAATGGFAKYIETTDPKDFSNNINLFVTKGYDVVVTVGFLMGEATIAAAKASPSTQFIGVDQFQSEPLDNLTGLVFPEDKAGYAAGYLAGLTTKTGKIGAVLGTDTVPPVKLFGEGFRAGALAANPSVDVTLVYHEPNNAFNDPEWGASEAKKQLAQGNDVIFGVGGKTGNGALIETAKAAGAGSSVFCIGVDTDQYETVPEARKCLLTSAEKNLAQGTSDLVVLAKTAASKGGNFSGSVGLAPYHDADSVMPTDIKGKIDQVIAGLMDGTITTGVSLS